MAIIERTNVIDIKAGVQYVYQKAGIPANGDFNGEAETGQLLVDTTNGKAYINTGTKAATIWTSVGSQT